MLPQRPSPRAAPRRRAAPPTAPAALPLLLLLLVVGCLLAPRTAAHPDPPLPCSPPGEPVAGYDCAAWEADSINCLYNRSDPEIWDQISCNILDPGDDVASCLLSIASPKALVEFDCPRDVATGAVNCQGASVPASQRGAVLVLTGGWCTAGA